MPTNQQGQNQPRRQLGPFGKFAATVIRGIIIYLAISYVSKRFLGNNTHTESSPHSHLSTKTHMLQVEERTGFKWRHMFTPNDRFKLFVYLDSHTNPDINTPGTPLWSSSDLSYTMKEAQTHNLTLPLPSDLLELNTTYYVHLYLAKSLSSQKNFDLSQFSPSQVAYTRYPLTKFLPAPKKKTDVNLLTGMQDEEEIKKNQMIDELDTDKYLMYWVPRVEIRLVKLSQQGPPTKLPDQYLNKMQLDEQRMLVKPIFYVNEFWLYKEHLIPVNNTVSELPLSLSFEPLSDFKWMLFIQTESSFKFTGALGTSTEDEAEEMKKIISDTNPYFLGLTLLVSVLHSIFDMLAFKNDIRFWKNRKSIVGISVRSIFMNIGMQVVILLYLIENQTSLIISISSAVGLAIEIWKVSKATKCSITWRHYLGVLPKISFADKESYAEKTKQYDAQAMKVLNIVLVPLVLGYSIYSLYYNTHRNWYAFVLESLVGTVYVFGFIMMTPQLFINYKLKSVAHLPWRVMCYKFLNTIVDDLFAFVIKMPVMHRIACFRDDVVFLIYLYQRWIYKVDTKRKDGIHWEDDQVLVDERDEKMKPEEPNFVEEIEQKTEEPISFEEKKNQ